MSHQTPSVMEKLLSSTTKSFERKPVYLFYGSDVQRLTEVANRIKDLIASKAGEENYFRYVRFGGDSEPGAGDVIAQLNTVSMFGGEKLAYVGPVESLKKKETEIFIDYLASPNSDSTLILTIATSKDDYRALATLEKSKLVKIAAEVGEAVKFGAPRANDLAAWALKRFEAKSVKADREAVRRLVELTDGDSGRVATEIEKLVSYVGDAACVTIDDVEETVGDHKENKIWDLLDSIRRRDTNTAIATLNNLTAHQNVPPQMILKMLTSDLLKLWAANEGKRSGERPEDVAKRMGQAPFALKKVWGEALLWDESKVRLALNEVLNAALDPMRYGIPAESAMSKLVLRLCRAG